MASRASTPWRRAAVLALAVHAVLFALAIGSVKIAAPPPEPPAVGVELIRLQPPPPRHGPRPLRAASRPAPPPTFAARVQPVPAPSSQAASAPAPSPPSPSEGDAAGRVRAMLRGSVGCGSAAVVQLDETERRKCAGARMAHVDPDFRIPAPIDPVKRSWFDADLHYRELNRRMPMGPPGSLSEEGKKLTYGQPPGHALFYFGPLSVGLPAGAFNDDSAPPP